jgi:transmembrane sensor
MDNREITKLSESKDADTERLEAAALWFAELEDNVADVAAFEAWRTDPANALAFVRVSGSADWFEKRKHLVDSEKAKIAPQGHFSRRQLLLSAVAAGAGLSALLVGAGFVALFNPGRAMAETGVGQRSSLSLPDGGRIDVNTDSKVLWHYRGAQRELWLDRGEVAITVAAGATPVHVKAGKQTVALSQGVFDLRLSEGALRVSVIAGTCTLPQGAAGVPQARVAAGKAVTVSQGTQDVREMSPDETDAITAWQKDEIVFTGSSLRQAVSEYNRYLTRKIDISDPAISEVQIGGRFTTRDPAEFLAALKTSFGLTVEDQGSGPIEIKK